MRKSLFLLLTLLTAFAAGAQMKFEHLGKDWGDVFVKAQQEQKMVFVDVYTDWCGPCKVMSRDIFPQKPVGDYFNKHFINVKANVTQGQDAVWLRDSLEISNYPTLLYFSPEGKLVHQNIGGVRDYEKFIEMGEEALDPERQYFTLLQRFEQGERGLDLIHSLASAEMSAFAGSKTDILLRFFREIPRKDWSQKQYWPLIKENVYKESSFLFQQVLQRRQEFTEGAGQKEVDQFLNKIFDSSQHTLNYFIGNNYKVDNLDEFHRTSQLAEALGRENEMAPAYLYIIGQSPNMEQYYKQAAAFADLEYNPSFGILYNSVAWAIVENTQEPKHLSVADRLVDFALKDMDEASFKDTKACILYQQGKVQEAIALQTEAVAQAKAHENASPEYIASLEENLTKMTNNQKLF